MLSRLAAVTAVAVIAVAGVLTFGGLGKTPGPDATPTMRPTPPPTPAATRINQAIGYPDLPGWIVFEHFGQTPDGSLPAFDPDVRMIWLVHADGTGLHELAPGRPDNGKVSPDIAPDGSKVAFATWAEPNLIYEVSIDGGEPHQLSEGCSGGDECREGDPSYSPDGTRLAFVRTEPVDGAGSSVIMIRDLRTGKAVPLEQTRVDTSEAYDAQPSWSPDGSKIVYYRGYRTESDERITDARLVIVDIANETLTVPDLGPTWAGDPDWSPDGSTIVFSSFPNREGEGYETPPPYVYTIKPDGSDLTSVCGANVCLGGGIAPSWTSDGRIFFWGYRTWALMNADGSQIAHINAPELTWFGDDLGYGYAGFLQPTG